MKDLSMILLGVVCILLFWIMACRLFPEHVIPLPQKVFLNLIYNADIFFSHFWQTAKEAFLGLFISIVVASLLTILVILFPFSEKIFFPYIVLLKATPIVAFVPLLSALFGTGEFTKILASFILSLFPLVIAGFEGIKAVPQRLLDISRIYGGSRLSIGMEIRLGYIVREFLIGARTASSLSVVGACVGEFITGNSNTGLGIFIIYNRDIFTRVNLYSAIILTTALGFLFFSVSWVISYTYERRLHLEK
jgi:ABC-type nitrate/sulfonate/bicarbonate transport system permease component